MATKRMREAWVSDGGKDIIVKGEVHPDKYWVSGDFDIAGLAELRDAITEILGDGAQQAKDHRRVVAVFRDEAQGIIHRFFEGTEAEADKGPLRGRFRWGPWDEKDLAEYRARADLVELDPATMEPLAKGVEAKP